MEIINDYQSIRSGGRGFFEQDRGLIAVWGKEAVQFLDGLITNDMKTLADGNQMLAAFPNAQGRLLAVVRVMRQGEKFLFETEASTREKLFQNLFRFTFAGDFFVEDLSEQYRYFALIGSTATGSEPPEVAGGTSGDSVHGSAAATVSGDIGDPSSNTALDQPPATAGGNDPRSDVLVFNVGRSSGCFVPADAADDYKARLLADGLVEINDDLYETLRIENGIPTYGVDMDETTIVPELGIDELISYNKGCYIGQEIIARIHFRGHVAKQLTGLIMSVPGAVAAGFLPDAELKSIDGKNAGRITSVTFSPALNKTIALAYVRYDYLEAGTELLCGEVPATVTALPFIGQELQETVGSSFN